MVDSNGDPLDLRWPAASDDYIEAAKRLLLGMNERGELGEMPGDPPTLSDKTIDVDGRVDLDQGWLKAGTQVGQWILEERIGSGAFGKVFAARDTEIEGRRAALKFLRFDVDDELVSRFRQEASLMAMTAGDHVPHVYDIGTVGGRTPYLAMELLRGCSLLDRLAMPPPATDLEAFDITAQLCAGLSRIHRAGIVHRDLAPKNVFLCDDPPGRVKVLDFGLSKGSHYATEGRIEMGTLPYTSPEVFGDGGAAAADARADIHAVGALLFELLCGVPAFTGNAAELVARIVSNDRPSVLAHRPELSEEVASIVARAMAPHREQRFQTIDAFARALEMATFGRQSSFSAIEVVAPVAPELATAKVDVVFRPENTLAQARSHEQVIDPALHGVARRAALGLPVGPRGEGEVERVNVSDDPTLDEMLAAELVARAATGQRPPLAVRAYANYAAVARDGLGNLDRDVARSLAGLYLALRSQHGDRLHDPADAALFLDGWSSLMDVIDDAMDRGVGPLDPATFEDDRLLRLRSYLDNDQRVYRQDVRRGQRWLVTFDGAPDPASALVLHEPKSILFKHWARTDEQAPTGDCYLLLIVEWPDGGWVVSTDPTQGLPIRSVYERLQQLERKHGDRAWFAGERFVHTLVAAPHEGSLIPRAELLDALRDWGRARIV